MSEHKTLSRGVLGTVAAKTMRLYIPEWEGEIILRQFTHAEKAEIEVLATEAFDSAKRVMRNRGGMTRTSFAFIRSSWVDEEGNHVLTEDDYLMLIKEPNAIIERILDAIRAFNALSDDAVSEAKKNLIKTTNGASGIS